MRGRIIFLSLFLITPFIIIIGCKQTIDPWGDSHLILELEDVSCTEAWITLKAININLPADITLKQYNPEGGEITRKINLSRTDTLLVIEGLLPNKRYSFAGFLDNNNKIKSELSLTTMDTTSHDFTWEIFTFGDKGNSVLYDVAIIDENNIWAVGEIYTKDTYTYDSLGNWIEPYNAVHWDGTKWELKRIGNVGGWVCHSILAFSRDDVWFEGKIKWDGTKYKVYNNGWPLMPNGDGWRVYKMWGTSSNDLYAVGEKGMIAHWDGKKWTKIESGTDLHIYDIWGDQTINGNYEILSVAADHFISPERKILSIKNNSVQEVSTSNISIGSIYGIWFKAGRKYFVVGNGIYTKGNVNNENNWIALHNGLTPYYTYAIRGTALNNIFICGSYGETLFFNGISWTTFRNTPGFYDVEFYRADIKQNIIAAVGYKGNKASVVIGKNKE